MVEMLLKETSTVSCRFVDSNMDHGRSVREASVYSP